MPYLQIGESQIYYNVKGEGTPIIFIHPPTLTSVNFDYQVKQLSQYFKVITFDIRGHGNSPHSHQPITYNLIANDIVKLLDHLNISKTYVCGYSTGGSIVLHFLHKHPNRALGGIVLSGMSEVSDKLLKDRISLGVKLAKTNKVNLLSASISLSKSNNLRLFMKMYNAARKGDAENIKQYYQYSLNYNCTHVLKDIKQPTLLIYGEKDIHFHRYASILASQLKNSNLEFIKGVNHRIPTKAKAEVNRLINHFITKQML